MKALFLTLDEVLAGVASGQTTKAETAVFFAKHVRASRR